METTSKKFRPFVYMILALGVIATILVIVIYGKLFEEIDTDSAGAPSPALQEKIEPGHPNP